MSETRHVPIVSANIIKCYLHEIYCIAGQFGSDNVWQKWMDEDSSKKVW